MWIKRLTLVVALLASSSALALDRHIFRDTDATFADPDGDNQLNDCPNPLHNSKGVAGNTDELTYCVNTYNTQHDGRIICDAGPGCQPWTVSTQTCQFCAPSNPECDPGTVANVTNGSSLRLTTGTTYAPIYANAQACIWNMGRSDDCHIHAGTYKRPGMIATSAVDLSGSDTTGAACARSECYQAFFGAFGNGPTLDAQGNQGYGTASDTGDLRGAVLNGSTDTWDTDNDKIPDRNNNSGSPISAGLCVGGTDPGSYCKVGTTLCAGGGTCSGAVLVGVNQQRIDAEPLSYPPIFNGDTDGDCDPATGTGCWESTNCNSSGCTGDAFYIGFVGCGYNMQESYNCDPNLTGVEQKPRMDVDADGLHESTEQLPPTTIRNVSFFRIKDIEFEYFNGGAASFAATCGGEPCGIREYLGHLTLSGGNTTSLGNGMGMEHVFWHHGFYSRMAADEHFTAVIGDNENSWGVVPKVLKDSVILSGNRFVFNDDCGEYGQCGGSWDFDGNLIVIQNRRSDGATWATTGPGASSQGEFQTVFRTKSWDTLGGSPSSTTPKVGRFRRNIVIRQRSTPGNISAGVWYNECFGHCFRTECSPSCGVYHQPLGYGQFWDYGNIYRLQDEVSPSDATWGKRSFGFCSVDGLGGSTGAQQWFIREFSNTIDIEKPDSTSTTTLDEYCNGTGTHFRSKGNAFFGATDINNDVAADKIATGNVCPSTSGNVGCTAGGSTRSNWFQGPKNLNIFSTLAGYKPATAGTHVLDNTGSCDPDGDGINGVDWDNNPATGVSGNGQELQWTDLAGNLIDCSVSANPAQTIDIGAMQNFSYAPITSVCGNNVVETGPPLETCDDGSQAVNNCQYGDGAPGDPDGLQQVCNSSCNGLVDCQQPRYCGDSQVTTPNEDCDGALLNGHTCSEFGLGCTGTPTCNTTCDITSLGCTCPIFPDFDGGALDGGAINP